MHISKLLSSPQHGSTSTKTLLCGDPGSGKTRAAIRLAQSHNIVLFDFDNALVVLKNDIERHPELYSPEVLSRITLFSLKNFQDPNNRAMPQSMWMNFDQFVCDEHQRYMCQGCKGAGKSITGFTLNNPAPNTVYIIDSLTAVNDTYLSAARGSRGPDYKFQLDDWGVVANYSRGLLANLRASAISLVVTGHYSAARSESEVTSRLYPVLGSDKLTPTIPGVFTEVYYCARQHNGYLITADQKLAGNHAVVSRTSQEHMTLDTTAINPLFPLYKVSALPTASV